MPISANKAKEFFVDNSDSYNGVKDDNISTPQNDAAKSSEAAMKMIQNIINGDEALTEANLTPFLLNASKYLTKELIPEISNPKQPLGDPSEATSITGCIGMMDRLKGGGADGTTDVSKLSLIELMTLVSTLLLVATQDKKDAEGEMRRLNREIASVAAAVSFELKMQAAKDTREASKLEAIGQIVEGSMSVIAGITSLTVMGIGARNVSNKQSSNSVDSETAKTKMTNAFEKARAAQALIEGLGKITSGGLKIEVSAKRYSAEAKKINAELADSYKQTTQETASILLQNMRDDQQSMNNTISNIQQIQRCMNEATQNMIKNA